MRTIHLSKSPFLKFMNRPGFTLIEMAVVMVVVGIIISIMATVLPSLIQSGKIKKARAILEKVDYALQGYSIANHRLPFADGDADGNEDTDVYVGDLPYLTMGLSSNTDPWGNTIKYGVYGETGGLYNLTTIFADEDAFCAAISSASTAAFTTSIVYTTTADPCGGANATNSNNQAYVVSSGGAKDLDGVNSFFDLCNGENNPGFNTPNKIQSTTYDDLVRAFALNEILQKNCTGGGGSGGGGENTYTNGCTNGVDDDGDGDIDCADSDCAGDPACSGGGPNVDITTSSIPSGPVNSDYLTSFNAIGGTTPYEWTLTADGGFSDFNLNAFTGLLTGTLDQCPGTYNIGVQVVDSTLPADGGPTTDSDTFSLQVPIDLEVSRTSGPTVIITWSSSLQEETFEANGGRLGSINWVLDAGGATGFAIFSTGANTCVVKKNGATTAGTYTFTLTATDASCAGNTDDLELSVTVTASGSGTPGIITGAIDTLEFDTANGEDPSLVHVSGEVFAIAYRGPGGDGWLKTVTINAAGSITDTGNSLEFDTANGEDPSLVHVSGDVFAVAYQGPGGDGWLKTVTINAAGSIADTGNSLEFDTVDGNEPHIVHVNDDIFAVAYRGPSDDGFVKTVSIATDGQINGPVIDSLEFDPISCYEPDIIYLGGGVVAIAYRGSTGSLITIAIAEDGDIGNTVIDSNDYTALNGAKPSVIMVNANILAVAYSGGGTDGFLTTMELE